MRKEWFEWHPCVQMRTCALEIQGRSEVAREGAAELDPSSGWELELFPITQAAEPGGDW